MIVVADASVLIGLSSIQHLALLRGRFPDGVFIPPAVWKEVVEQGGEKAGALEVSKADWIRVHDFAERGIVNLLQMELEQGEVEAIALAYEIDADLVLLDERDARGAAVQLGLHVLGTVGVLLWAKQSGQLSNLRAALDALRAQAKFRLSQALYDRENSDPKGFYGKFGANFAKKPRLNRKFVCQGNL